LGPWCYTTDPIVRWEYCFVLYCSPCDRKTLNEASLACLSFFNDTVGCKTDLIGESYDGKMQSTPEGLICQRLDSQHPHTHGFVTWTSHGGITQNENFFRNPGKAGSVNSIGPLCFTMDQDTPFEF
ncbi:hypothetical protein CAPTEDRAFT_32699, partial [Capitella teleta]